MSFKKSRSSAATIDEVFSENNTYMSPLFQRHFVWDDEQLSALWADIDSVLDEETTSRFLGAIVLKPLFDEPAPFRPHEHWIVDGQQRLTTFYTLLIACAYRARTLGAIELADDIVTGYVIHKKKAAKREVKLLPTIPDLRQFREILKFIEEYHPKIPGGTYGKDFGKLADVFIRHCEEIDKRILMDGIPSAELLEKFIETLLVGIEFVVINLAKHHDANEVFNRLNIAGQPLQIIDLIRNEVFSLFASNAAEAESIYENKWILFEESLELPGKENEKLSAALKDSYFFPFTLIHDSTITKARIFNYLSKKWHSEIQSIESMEGKAVHIITELSEFVGPYRSLYVGEKYHSFGDSLWEVILRFYRMPAPSSLYPYAMKLLKSVSSGQAQESDAEACLRTVESFLVRRAFLGLEPTGLHTVFKGLWKKAGADVSLIPENLQTNTIEFPDDDRFKDRILEGDLYHRRLRNYIFLEYERSFKKGDPLPDTADITADHIMPQTRQGEWKQTISEEDHESLLHTWANLVPMSAKANAEKGTSSWAESKEMYKGGSNFKSTKEVALANENWTTKEICARGEKLMQWALTRWPYRIDGA